MHLPFVIHTGFEPVTSSLSRRRSKPTELMNHFMSSVRHLLLRYASTAERITLTIGGCLKKASFVIHTGFEPVTSSLSRRRSKPTELMNHFMSSVRPLRLRYAVNRRTDNLDHRRPSKKASFVIRMRLERMTVCLEGRCSIQLSYRTSL